MKKPDKGRLESDRKSAADSPEEARVELDLTEPQVPSEFLRAMLRRVKSDNLHAEVDLGPPVGKEFW